MYRVSLYVSQSPRTDMIYKAKQTETNVTNLKAVSI